MVSSDRFSRVGLLLLFFVLFQSGVVSAQSSRSRKAVVSDVVLPNLNDIFSTAESNSSSTTAKPVVKSPVQEVQTSSVPTTFFGDFDSDKEPSTLAQPDPPGAEVTAEGRLTGDKQYPLQAAVESSSEVAPIPKVAIECAPQIYQPQPVYWFYRSVPHLYYSSRPSFIFSKRRNFQPNRLSWSHSCWY